MTPAQKLTFSVRFYPRRSKRQGKPEIPIYIRLTVNGEREEWCTQRYCIRGQWDTGAGRISGTGAKARSVNTWLEAMNARAHECRQQLFATGKPFTARHIRKLMQGEDLEPPKMLSEAWTYYITYIAGLVGKGYSYGTLQKYNSTYKVLKKYLQLKYQSEDIRLDELDHRFIKDYEFYLKAGHGVQHNTAVQMIKKLRTMVRIALDFGWLTRDPFLAHRMKTDEVHRDYLTGEELSNLAAKKIRSKRLAIVRDLFLFSCYTGLSFADVVKLSADDLYTGEDGERWLQTHRVKNNNRVRIPVLPPALMLIDHYKDHPRTPEGKILPDISNQKANSYLKEINKLMGFKKGITFHCARHTFATTVTLTNGVPLETVGQMLGHKSIKTTQHYARVTDNKVRTDMQPLRERYQGQALYLSADYTDD